jgi:hypothetical protein
MPTPLAAAPPLVFPQTWDTHRYAWMGVVIAGGFAIAPNVVTQCMDGKSVKEGGKLINDNRMSQSDEWLCVDNIVTDPANRDGELIKINDCLEKAEGIESHGLDFSKVRIILVELGEFH